MVKSVIAFSLESHCHLIVSSRDDDIFDNLSGHNQIVVIWVFLSVLNCFYGSIKQIRDAQG